MDSFPSIVSLPHAAARVPSNFDRQQYDWSRSLSALIQLLQPELRHRTARILGGARAGVGYVFSQPRVIAARCADAESTCWILTANTPQSYTVTPTLTVVVEQQRIQVGDTVIVKGTGRRALITAVLPEGHYQVEFLPEPAEDPIDRDSSVSADEGGVYLLDDLAPAVP